MTDGLGTEHACMQVFTKLYTDILQQGGLGWCHPPLPHFIQLIKMMVPSCLGDILEQKRNNSLTLTSKLLEEKITLQGLIHLNNINILLKVTLLMLQ